MALGGHFRPDQPSAILPRTPRSIPGIQPQSISRLTFTRNIFHDAKELARALQLFPGLRAVTVIEIDEVHSLNHPQEFGSLELTAATSRRRGSKVLGRTSALIFLQSLICRRPRRSTNASNAFQVPIVTTRYEAHTALIAVLSSLANDYHESRRTAAAEVQYQAVRHIHREKVDDARFPIIQVTSLVSCKTGDIKHVSLNVSIRRSFRLKYGPSSILEYDEDGTPVVTVTLQELHIETFEEDIRLLSTAMWSAFARRVCRLLDLQRLVFVSKNPAHAEALVRDLGRTALRAIPEPMLAAGRLQWGELEDIGDCGHEEAVAEGCCGGDGGWQFGQSSGNR